MGSLPKGKIMKISSFKPIVVMAAVAAMLIPGLSLGLCSIDGHIAAEMTGDPDLPLYAYTMTVNWDMDAPYGLSHLDLLVDILGGTCDCSDFSEAITFGSGTSTGDDDCTVEYEAFLECNGDPSIPGVDGILFKFEPIEDEFCEPGPVGSGTFVFYSDLGPVPVNEDILAVVDKAGQESCTGTITGVFPGMSCDPVPTDGGNLGSLKSLYR